MKCDNRRHTYVHITQDMQFVSHLLQTWRLSVTQLYPKNITRAVAIFRLNKPTRAMLTYVDHKYNIRKASIVGCVRKSVFRILFSLLVFTSWNFNTFPPDVFRRHMTVACLSASRD